MKKAKLRKKLTTHRRTRCHWCHLIMKDKPIDGIQIALLHRR